MMKNKRGFTLVELIAVIAILGVILILIVPDIVEYFGKGKKDAFVRQIQSVWKEAEKEYSIAYAEDLSKNSYCDKNSSMSNCVSLSLNKTDLSYYVTFDNSGEIDYIAMGDSNYCYVNDNPTDIDVASTNLVEGALSCSGSSCSCTASSNGGSSSGSGSIVVTTPQYFYWGYTSYYDSDHKLDMPARATESYENIPYYDEGVSIMRTSMMNGSVIAQDVCIYYNDKLFCLGPNYWEGEGIIGDQTSARNTADKLKNDIEQTLGISDVNCESSFSYWELYGWASCDIGNYACNVNYDGSVSCGSNWCSVDANGWADCS